jgi:nucleotide-binding universal stress UspA family protein
MFKHILVLLEETVKPELPVSHAAAMAKTFGSRLTVMQLPECLEEKERSQDLVYRYVEVSKHAYKQLQMVRNLLQSELKTGFQIVTRDSLQSGVSFVLRSDADLLVLPDLSRHTRPVPFGCGLEILKHCQISTLIVRPRGQTLKTHPSLYERILVPIRMSSSDTILLPYVSELASAFESHLVFVRVLVPPNEENLEPSGDARSPHFQQRLEETEQFLEQRLKPKNVPYHLCLFPGSSVIHGVYSVAESENVDLIVLKSHGPLSIRDQKQLNLIPHLIENGTRSLLLIQGRRSRPARALKQARLMKEEAAS